MCVCVRACVCVCPVGGGVRCICSAQRGIQVDAKVLDSLVAKTLPDVSKHLQVVQVDLPCCGVVSVGLFSFPLPFPIQAHKVESLLFCVEWFMSVFSR